jgi:signal transduction histidine kinase
MIKRVSLVGRLIQWQIIAMTFAWACLLAWVIYSMLGFGSGDLDKRLRYLASMLAETSALSLQNSTPAERQLQTVANMFSKVAVKSLKVSLPYVETYQIFSADNTLLYRSPAAPEMALVNAAGIADVHIGGEAFRAIRVASDDGRVSVVLAESMAFRRATMLPLLTAISVSQVLIFLVCVFVLWYVARRSFAPVKVLADTLNARKAGDLTALDNSTTYQEIAPLVSELNALLARESSRLDLERGFLADAAHELRTPLAAMSAQAHLLLGASEPQARIGAATRLQAGLERVSHLLAQLLTIARIDASDAYTRGEVIDAAEALRECLVEHIPAAQRLAITLELEAPEAVPLFISKLGFESIVNNLVDNALRYTPAGGNVAVSLSVSGAGCELSVQDDGPGIQVELHTKVFERFFRAPGSDAPGSGLGLAIVQKIAAARGAAVRLGDGLGGRGVGVVLLFPPTP